MLEAVLLIIALLALYKIARDFYANFNPPYITGLTPLGMLSCTIFVGVMVFFYKLGWF